MRYFILKSFLILSFLFTSSCKNTGTTEQGNYFYTVIDKYFGEYGPREKVWINKPVNKYAIAEVEKSKLSLNDFEIIQKRLENDGWKLISSHDGFFEYCLDKKIYMGVLYPIKKKHYGYDGEEIRYENINEWSIGLSYNDAGVKHCIRDEIPVINLD